MFCAQLDVTPLRTKYLLNDAHGRYEIKKELSGRLLPVVMHFIVGEIMLNQIRAYG